jgi:hypothetical protein
MKGRSQKSRILFFLLALCFLLLQGWKTPAPFVDLTYFELTFFVRTNAAGGFVETRGFDSQGSLDKQRFFTGVRLIPSGVANE